MRKPTAWRDRSVYFVLGAFLGFVMGAAGVLGYTDGRWPHRLTTLLLVGLVGAAVCGVLAAWLGEAFFDHFRGLEP